MNLSYSAKLSVTALLLLSLTSCSLFSPGRQTVKIVPDDPNATIFVNGENMGKGVVVTRLKKTKSAAITASCGEKHGVAILSSELSPTGVLDIIGGCLFLFPFLGFMSGGAFQLDQDTVPVHLN